MRLQPKWSIASGAEKLVSFVRNRRDILADSMQSSGLTNMNWTGQFEGFTIFIHLWTTLLGDEYATVRIVGGSLFAASNYIDGSFGPWISLNKSPITTDPTYLKLTDNLSTIALSADGSAGAVFQFGASTKIQRFDSKKLVGTFDTIALPTNGTLQFVSPNMKYVYDTNVVTTSMTTRTLDVPGAVQNTKSVAFSANVSRMVSSLSPLTDKRAAMLGYADTGTGVEVRLSWSTDYGVWVDNLIGTFAKSGADYTVAAPITTPAHQPMSIGVGNTDVFWVKGETVPVGDGTFGSVTFKLFKNTTQVATLGTLQFKSGVATQNFFSSTAFQIATFSAAIACSADGLVALVSARLTLGAGVNRNDAAIWLYEGGVATLLDTRTSGDFTDATPVAVGVTDDGLKVAYLFGTHAVFKQKVAGAWTEAGRPLLSINTDGSSPPTLRTWLNRASGDIAYYDQANRRLYHVKPSVEENLGQFPNGVSQTLAGTTYTLNNVSGVNRVAVATSKI